MNLILGKSLLTLDSYYELALSNLHPSWSPVRLKDSETNQCSKLGFFRLTRSSSALSVELLRVSVTFTKGSAKF